MVLANSSRLVNIQSNYMLLLYGWNPKWGWTRNSLILFWAQPYMDILEAITRLGEEIQKSLFRISTVHALFFQEWALFPTTACNTEAKKLHNVIFFYCFFGHLIRVLNLKGQIFSKTWLPTRQLRLKKQLFLQTRPIMWDYSCHQLPCY